MRNIVTCLFLEENSRLQWRSFREFRKSDTDIENNSHWRDFVELFHAQTATLHTKESKKA